MGGGIAVFAWNRRNLRQLAHVGRFLTRRRHGFEGTLSHSVAPRGGRCGSLLDRLPQVLLDDGKLCDHQLDGLSPDAGERGFHHGLAELAEPFEHRARRRRRNRRLARRSLGSGRRSIRPLSQSRSSSRVSESAAGRAFPQAPIASAPRTDRAGPAPPIAPG